MHTPLTNRALKYMCKENNNILKGGEKNPKLDVNILTLLSWLRIEQETEKSTDMEDTNNTIRQLTLTFIEHSTQQGSTFFPSIDQTFTKIKCYSRP